MVLAESKTVALDCFPSKHPNCGKAVEIERLVQCVPTFFDLRKAYEVEKDFKTQKPT